MGFAEQLRKARLRTGMNQQQVAEALGVTGSTYCGYETGKRQPDVLKIKRLAEILGTSGDVLLETGFGMSGDRSRGDPEDYEEAVSLLRRMDAETLKCASAQLRALLEYGAQSRAAGQPAKPRCRSCTKNQADTNL